MTGVMPELRFIDGTLRHGQQELLDSHLRLEDALLLATELDECGFAALEVFGGLTFEASLSVLSEEPFERLSAISAVVRRTPLMASVAGQSLAGHNAVADDVVDAFYAAAAAAGVTLFRVHDPLNDLDNVSRSVVAAHAAGAKVQAALLYTVSPAHTEEYFCDRAQQLAHMGVDSICLLDPAGLLSYDACLALLRGFAETGLPMAVSSTDACGLGSQAALAARDGGASTLDTAFSWLAGGASLPAIEPTLFSLRLKDDGGVGWGQLGHVHAAIDRIASAYGSLMNPRAFRPDPMAFSLRAVPATLVHLREQLQEQRLEDSFGAACNEVERVHRELGFPPLVSPVAEMVATQAVYNLAGGDRYATVSHQVRDYCLGLWGRPPVQVDPEIAAIVNGKEQPITCRPADLLSPGMEPSRQQLIAKGFPEPSRELIVDNALFPGSLDFLLKEDSSVAAATAEGSTAASMEESQPLPAGEAAEPLSSTAGPPMEERVMQVEVDGEQFSVVVRAAAGTFGTHAAAASASEPQTPAAGGAGDTVVSPMQGVIVKVNVAVGQSVAAGEVVAVLEAMKMQNDVCAVQAGTVKAIYVAPGDVVAGRAPICRLG